MSDAKISHDQAVLDELCQAITVKTCGGGCRFRPRLVLDAEEKLTGAWMCPMIGRITCDDAPRCRFYRPGTEECDG